MLSEAHVLQEKGKDVVVGIVETHGRIENRATS
jgi:K+-sensing histidine kinase KdpD